MICGDCKYHKHIYTWADDHPQGGWVCVNERSDHAGCYTDYEDTCEDWEDKDGCE